MVEIMEESRQPAPTHAISKKTDRRANTKTRQGKAAKRDSNRSSSRPEQKAARNRRKTWLVEKISQSVVQQQT